ncbi:amidohydrolase family protein [Desulfotruncus alcoholivorax]|uniref:amidohydrolase family protein n=1 Tax=Desulfotruncus alcoholivorax TaxID=265477 RepID=UPI0003FB9EB9|nr:amidohydrolase family protein [Desulfotruncus alcoholivorax]
MKIMYFEKTKNYMINAGRIIDNGGFCATGCDQGGTLYVEENRIAAVTSRNEAYSFSRVDYAAVEIDLGGLTILPPLIDCHVHLALDGVDFSAALKRWDNPEELDHIIEGQLRDTLNCGVLAVRDGGDRRGIARQAKSRCSAPLIKSPVHALRKPETYGAFLGRGTLLPETGNVLDHLVMLGADHVKVIVSGVVSFKEYGKVGPVQYTLGELAQIVHGAHRRGLKVMAHASSDEAVSLSIAAGVDTIEHGYFLSDDSLSKLAEKRIPWIPTVIPVAAQLHNPAAGGNNRLNRYVIEKTVERQLAMINKAPGLGVMLGVGTDAGAGGVRHGYGFHQELELYRNAGLSNSQILQSATLNGANILNLGWGRIQPGRPAAFIAVAGNPLDNLAALKRVQYAFLPGQSPPDNSQ